MVRVMAAIANGGWLVTPHVVSLDGTARTATDIDDRPKNLSRRRISGLTEGTLTRVREGLRAVVQEPYGTGYKTVRLAEVAIAGKTGTAENGPGKADHAWFVGYVPADEPQYAFVVVLEHGGSGSRGAGPVTQELVQKMLDTDLVSAANGAP
jgi:penicillin-binding protein 2